MLVRAIHSNIGGIGFAEPATRIIEQFFGLCRGASVK